MIAALCLDDNNGMMFNHRRQSRDSRLIANLVDFASGRRILVNDFSAELFAEYRVCVDTDFLKSAGCDDICFVENEDISSCIDRVHTLVIYRWNRKYPSDKRFNLDIVNLGYKLSEVTEFSGTSHDRITREVYIR